MLTVLQREIKLGKILPMQTKWITPSSYNHLHKHTSTFSGFTLINLIINVFDVPDVTNVAMAMFTCVCAPRAINWPNMVRGFMTSCDPVIYPGEVKHLFKVHRIPPPSNLCDIRTPNNRNLHADTLGSTPTMLWAVWHQTQGYETKLLIIKLLEFWKFPGFDILLNKGFRVKRLIPVQIRKEIHIYTKNGHIMTLSLMRTHLTGPLTYMKYFTLMLQQTNHVKQDKAEQSYLFVYNYFNWF